MLLMNKTIGTVARMGGCPAYLGEFVDSFTDLVQWNAQYLCAAGETVYYPWPPKCSLHDVARNILSEQFRGEWLLMLDADHAFEPDLCWRMLNIAEKTGVDVVTGIYQYRAAPHSPVLYMQRGKKGLVPVVDWDASVEALEVDSAGAGCLLVKRAVFDLISTELHEQPFSRIEGYGEDHSFFLRCKKLGVKAVAATKVECHHLQVRPLSLSDYDRTTVEADEPESVRGYR